MSLIETIKEQHICGFNDGKQNCDCFIAGIKFILQELVDREEKENRREKFPQMQCAIYWRKAKQDTISYLESQIKELEDIIK